jgi:hypothetical protein
MIWPSFRNSGGRADSSRFQRVSPRGMIHLAVTI